MSLSDLDFQRADGLADWRVINRGGAAWFAASSHAAGAELLTAVAALDPQPDVGIRRSGVRVFIARPAAGFGDAELAAARALSRAAAQLGLRPEPALVRGYQVAIDALSFDAVMPFWAAVLGFDDLGYERLADPLRRAPGVWFQQLARPRPGRDRVHLDIARVGGVAAESVGELGGEFLGGPYGLWVCDAEGNEADLVPAGPLSEDPATGDWQAIFAGVAAWRAGSAAAAADLARDCAGLADRADLAVRIDVRGERVVVDSGKDRWETEAGFADFAAAAQAAARRRGLAADPAGLCFVQYFLDAVDVPAVRAFWQAVLGYEPDPRTGVDDLNDPCGVGPDLVFQDMAADAARSAQRNRLHLDVFVPDDEVRAVVDRGLAAGGRLVADNLPYAICLADPEGNEVDVAVVPGRPAVG